MTIYEKTEQFVCISCVDEVRYSFVSHLSEALRRKGIKDVVIDVDSDDLLSKDSQAELDKARVSVMVLPGNCDPSKVWLDKFVKVLEFSRNKDQVVVPVLYGDSPLQDEWLSALNLGGLSPIHQSRKECSDAKLVEEIVRDVYDKLFYMGRIGINSKLLEIENMVCKQPLDDIRCVGIWGMPGIGKTTLAKALFDQISGEFDAYCFIKDYDKVIHENGLYRLLEEQFLKEKPGAYGDITKFSLLKNKLYNKRVLVVLDDVRNPLVAEPFLGGFDWFGPKSLIIITSRDKQVLRLCEVNQIYEVQGLNEKEARQLFSSCMEEQNLAELSMEVVKYANGHPLALKIYGRELKCKRKLSEMETAFLKLKRRPPFKIVDAFKSSYDTLSDSEKNIFLDIACFFQGENVDYVMQLLEGCGFFPHVGIDVLVEKHLVTISDNCVRMHNLIQGVGREIINGETVQVERRSRLWEPWSVKYLLEDNGEKENGEPKTTFKRSQGTKEIEGMFLDTSNLSFDVKPTAFENMLNLRLLKIYCSNPKNHPVINFPKGSLHSLPNELRLLHWENYSLQSLPQSFDPSHLVEINMPYSQLQKLWDGTENLEMLRTVRLCYSQQLVDIGDLLKAQNLEVIDLQGCTRLQSFPATGKLLHLRVVNLSGCTQVKSFPEIPPNIETLHLQGTGIEKLLIPKPNGGELVSLSELKGLSDALKLERLTSLEKSSLSSQVLGKLICLNLKDCSRLQSLPNMVSLKLLKVLDISGCSELMTIKGFPPNLKQLYIAGTAVRKVPQLPQSLQLLSAHGCASLKSVHFDFKKLPVHYTFSNCFDLSPQMVNVFLVRALSNAEHIPRERQRELQESPAFSFCAPSCAMNIYKLNLKPGSSVMTRLIPSWRNTLVGFAMLVEVAFSEDYCDATGFGIRCVCKWRNKEGHSHRIERNLHCWALEKAVQKAHMFVFCDVNMRPSTDEGNDPNIWADLVVFEFFPVSKQTKPLDGCCTVTTCGIRVITAANCNTSLENISPVLSLDLWENSGYGYEVVLRGNYDDLQEMDKVLFLYIACLFNDEDVDFVAPLIASIDLDVSSGLKVLAERSLIHVSSNGEIMMHPLLRQMGKEFLRNWTNNLADVQKNFYHGAPLSTHLMRGSNSQANSKEKADAVLNSSAGFEDQLKEVSVNISRHGKQNYVGESVSKVVDSSNTSNDAMNNTRKSTQKAMRTLFVNNVPHESNRRDLILAHFQKFGKVIDIHIPLNSERAFVQFSKREEAESALRAPDAVMGNRFIKLWWANRDSIPDNGLSTGNGASMKGRGMTASGGQNQLPITAASKSNHVSSMAKGPAFHTGGAPSSTEQPKPVVATSGTKVTLLQQKKADTLERLKETLRKKQEMLDQKRNEYRKKLATLEKQGTVVKGEEADEPDAKRLKVEAASDSGAAIASPKTESSTDKRVPIQKPLSTAKLSTETPTPDSKNLKQRPFSFTTSLNLPMANRYKLDNRTTTIKVVPPLPTGLANVAVLKEHFSSYGEVSSVELEDNASIDSGKDHETHRENRAACVTFVKRSAAEKALANAKCWQEHMLQLVWVTRQSNRESNNNNNNSNSLSFSRHHLRSKNKCAFVSNDPKPADEVIREEAK